MNLDRLQQSSETANAFAATSRALSPHPVFLTVEQFCTRNPAFTRPAMRNYIFKGETRQSTKGEIPGNGLIEAGAILRVGRKILVDEDRFFDWVRQQNEAPSMTAPRPRKPWAVMVVKPSSGARVVFSTFETQEEANVASSRLNSFGLVSRVELIRTPSAVPGSTVHAPQMAGPA